MWHSARRAEFERRVRAHLPDVLRLAQRLTGCPDTAEEVAQTALLNASRSWRTYRADACFTTWLYRIVVNVNRDRLRKSQPIHEVLPESIVDRRQVDPQGQIVHDELRACVQHAIARLPTRQREVIVLSVYEGMATEQIATALQISNANVHSTLFVARQQLRELLKPYFADHS
jgi:RNA polymerase sigma-70 factor (ECF subfamily)